MRLWSLHPSLLDAKGLVALWRETLLAQHVLLGKTKGYRMHPQLERFKQAADPLLAIACYLWAVQEEAGVRGYHFDASKINQKRPRKPPVLTVTEGQLAYEFIHLKNKLTQRDPQKLKTLGRKPGVHPLFTVIEGDIEGWERV